MKREKYVFRANEEGYRSGHNGAVLKTVSAKAHAGSSPVPSARKKVAKNCNLFSMKRLRHEDMKRAFGA